jgi:hypothetical protein
MRIQIMQDGPGKGSVEHIVTRQTEMWDVNVITWEKEK